MYLDEMGFPQNEVNLDLYSLEVILMVFVLVTYKGN